MGVVIWGVTPLGRHIANNLCDGDGVDIKPLAFVDNNSQLHNTLIDDILVISFKELEKRPDLGEITILIAVKNSKNIFQILEQLRHIPVLKVGMVKPRALVSNVPIKIFEENGEIIWSVYDKKIYKVVPRIEVNLIDACNLKCKGCTHFSSIYEENSFYPINEYKKDLYQLRKVGKFLRLRLLGGEPFLLSNLDEYIEIARSIFKESDIEIVTNGLLIPKADEKIISKIKENDISVTISPYRPTIKIKEQIAERLNKNKIWWRFDGKEVLQFSRCLTLESKHNAEISNHECLSAGCTFLRKGRLYKCPFDGLINDFYNYYRLDKKHESGTNIYQDANILYEEIVNYALNPVEMCQSCAEIPELIPWSVKSHPSLEDWLYKGEKNGNDK